MRLFLWFVWTTWILTLHAAAQHPPAREEGDDRPREQNQRGRQSSGGPTRTEPKKSTAVRGAGGKLNGKRVPLTGPHVCGGRCCTGWTLDSKTKRCTKPRCHPRCHGDALCRPSNRCVCRRGFSGYRCEVSTVTVSVPEPVLTPIHPSGTPRLNTKEPKPGSKASHRGGARRMRVLQITSGAVVMSPTPETTRGATLTNPPKSTKPDDRGVFKEIVKEEENSSSKGPQTEQGAENKARPAPVRDNEEGAGLTAQLGGFKREPQDSEEARTEERLGENIHVESVLWPETTLDLNQRSKTDDKILKTSTSWPEVEQGIHVTSDPRPKTEERLNLEFYLGPKKDDGLNQDSNPGPRGEKNLDVGVKEEKNLDVGVKEEKNLDVGFKGEKNVTIGVKGEKKKLEKNRTKSEEKKKEELKTRGRKKLSLSLREAQALLLRKSLSRGGRGDKMAAVLMKHIEKERKKLPAVTSSPASSNSSSSSSSSSSLSSLEKTSMKTFHTQRGQYTVYFTAPAADGQTVTGGAERIQVMFTPTICKVRCSQDRCVNYCERGNITTLFSSADGGGGGGGGGGRRDSSHGPGFRVFLCPLLCKNGGVCLQKDRCLCPPNFTGKFCQISVTPTTVTAAASQPSSINEIVKPAQVSATAANQELTQSEFLMPLGQTQEMGVSGAPSPSMVKVRVQHPPEASVKIHQVLKVSGYSPNLQTLSSSSTSGSAGAPAPAVGLVQAQTIRGGGTYTQQSGFKYCFREVKDGQCSSPLPGLRSREMCCRGIGKAWGITDCVLCPDNTGGSNSSCPAGFERANATDCVDVDECLQPGLCENGICVNTRGSYSCVCRAGFILDASHGICISQKVISEEKGQCYRVLGSGLGPSSCSLPILRNITKQICCCSRVGKAWGPNCQRCPYFGSVAFKEICPAGPGYHYSASALSFNQRANEQLGGRGASLVTNGNQDNQGPGSGSSGASRSPQNPALSGSSTSLSSSSVVGSAGSSRPSPPQPQPPPPPHRVDPSRPIQPGGTNTITTQDRPQTPGRPGTPLSRPDAVPSFTTQPRPQPPLTGSQAGSRFSSSSSSSSVSLPDRRDFLPAPAQPQSPERGSRPSIGLPPIQNRPAVTTATTTTTTRPARVQIRGVCESRPGVCGRGRCVDQPGGKHTCVCDQGYQPNSQRTYCQDVNECVQSPSVCAVGQCVNTMGSYRCICPSGYRSNSQMTSCQDIDECLQNPCNNGRCDNTPGSYRCVCRLGYRLSRNTCTDIDECEDPLQCPGQECINSQGSYRCVSCQPGYRLVNRLCTDIDECRQAPCSNGRCENTPGSYHCVCRHGYKLQNNTCADVNECSEPSQCPGQQCVNTVGSYRCVSCQPGYTLVNRQCTDINECKRGDSCPGQRCVNTEGSFSCVDCQQGYRSINGLCTDVDECEQTSQCPGQQCVNTMGSYRCVSCQPGYSGRDGSCQDIDECANAGVCEAGRVCINTIGSFRCDCAPGYRAFGLGRQCRDINECLEGDFCFPRGECVNSPGSYTCVCSPGFTLSDNKTACLDVDECLKSGVCLDGRCVNTEGSFHCQCQTGFTTNPEKTACLDVNECVSSGGSICGSKRCENTIGSYHCVTSCEPGYKVTETGGCADIDECANKTVCGDHAVCQNVIGTYLCVCHEGYTSSAEGKACLDVDECESQPGVCGSARCENVEGSFKCENDRQGYEFDSSSSNTAGIGTDADECVKSGVCFGGRCVNVDGTLQCRCQPGFTNNPEKTACIDVDECASSGRRLCGSKQCENTIGSYRCITSCESGYQLAQSGRCVDINECANKTVCGEHGFCQNLIGTHMCQCDQGYTSTADRKTCLDVDECEVLPDVCGSARCENVEGSFMCECDQEGYEFNPGSSRCIKTAGTALFVPGYPSTSSSSSSSSSYSSSSSVHASAVDSSLALPPLPPARPGELRECYYNLAERGTCNLLATNTTQQECCCTVGEGWGLGCQYHICPPINTAEFLSLCPSGRGYVTTGPGAFSYRDVDECKRFHPEVCKNGVCVNNIPGYNCYCSSGYVYNSTLLECVDHNECEEESCIGGVCVNTVGSYYCSCPHPLVLDDTQRNCVNSSHLAIDENLSVCWQHVTADLVCQSPLLGAQVTFMDCCCLYGEGWGMECALCPSPDSDDYATLCSSFVPLFPETYPETSAPETGVRPGPGRGGGGGRGGAGGAPPYYPPYSTDSFAPAVIPGRDFGAPDYDDYSPGGGSRPGFRGRTPATFSLPDGSFGRPEYGTGYYSEGDFGPPNSSPPRSPPFHLPPDPRTERAFGARPPPPSRADGAPLSLAPLPGAPYQEQEEEEEEEAWRPGPPFPPFTDRSRGGGGGAPRRVYERRYESYAGLSTAEDCGILHGCENGRCIRVAEGYTCDCYQGYELDMTSMTCIDINECEDGVRLEFPCVNARCVNTEGSFRCVCRRGYVMSRRQNHCVAA
ncbi:latent-transforming growth factor beta-binding protein 4 isoform X3 [Cheilinus undulatus]|uniref:latent-transforming growth factor beta-binding protein 4 isoform X3 n=1 Tax=Cheilinus undulatus TaxID=241271 RepID=UPI001BD6B193|nr:latent-transforming growth factor beta-binding protein 4 isoform X3 [Cheilinus undulatus]